MNRICKNRISERLLTSVCIAGPMLSLITDACGEVSPEARERAGERMTGVLLAISSLFLRSRSKYHCPRASLICQYQAAYGWNRVDLTSPDGLIKRELTIDITGAATWQTAT